MSPNQELHHHFLCGSSVEFYVEPINSCIDDTDTLISNVHEMAFTEDIPVLPDDVSGFLDTIDCSQITPYPDYPGFVKLRCLGKMRYNWHCKKFEFQTGFLPKSFYTYCHDPRNSSSEHIAEEERYCTGPAVKLIEDGNLPSDYCWLHMVPTVAKRSQALAISSKKAWVADNCQHPKDSTKWLSCCKCKTSCLQK